MKFRNCTELKKETGHHRYIEKIDCMEAQEDIQTKIRIEMK